MKSFNLSLILTSVLLTVTACDKTEKPKINKQSEKHAEAVKKAEDLERLIKEATEKRMKQVNGLD